MKKNVATVCAGITLVASIVAVSSWVELRKQREMNAARRERQIEVPLSASLPAAPTQATVAAATPPHTPISGTTSSTPSPAMKNPLMDLLGSPERMREAMKERARDPDVRKGLLKQFQMTRDRDYPNLAQELGLSPEEAEKLFDLLANDMLARMAEGSSLGGQIDVQEKNRIQQEFDRKREESIQAQLGDKYPQWQAYQQTLPARVEATAMNTRLVQAGLPLSTDQIKTLTTALIAEQQHQAEDKNLMPQSPSGNPADPGYRAQSAAEEWKVTQENNRRILAAVTPYIDSAQLEVLRKRMEQGKSPHEMVLRMQAQNQQATAQ